MGFGGWGYEHFSMAWAFAAASAAAMALAGAYAMDRFIRLQDDAKRKFAARALSVTVVNRVCFIYFQYARRSTLCSEHVPLVDPYT